MARLITRDVLCIIDGTLPLETFSCGRLGCAVFVECCLISIGDGCIGGTHLPLFSLHGNLIQIENVSLFLSGVKGYLRAWTEHARLVCLIDQISSVNLLEALDETMTNPAFCTEETARNLLSAIRFGLLLHYAYCCFWSLEKQGIQSLPQEKF